MDPIRPGIDLTAMTRALSPLPEEPGPPPLASPPAPRQDAGPPTSIALKDSASGRLFLRRNDPGQTGAQGAPNAERLRVDPGTKSPGEVIACKVVIGTAAAFAANLGTPVLLGTTLTTAASKAAIGGVGAAGVLTVCENAPQVADTGAGGAPGAR